MANRIESLKVGLQAKVRVSLASEIEDMTATAPGLKRSLRDEENCRGGLRLPVCNSDEGWTWGFFCRYLSSPQREVNMV